MCDVCGTRFGAGDLWPQSKFCLVCGEELSAWVKQTLTPSMRLPPPQVMLLPFISFMSSPSPLLQLYHSFHIHSFVKLQGTDHVKWISVTSLLLHYLMLHYGSLLQKMYFNGHYINAHILALEGCVTFSFQIVKPQVKRKVPQV
jgi:hypothetical protein